MEHFTFNCPTCGFEFDVEAENEDEAVNKIANARMGHYGKEHPEISQKEEAIKEEIRAGMEKRGE